MSMDGFVERSALCKAQEGSAGYEEPEQSDIVQFYDVKIDPSDEGVLLAVCTIAPIWIEAAGTTDLRQETILEWNIEHSNMALNMCVSMDELMGKSALCRAEGSSAGHGAPEVAVVPVNRVQDEAKGDSIDAVVLSAQAVLLLVAVILSLFVLYVKTRNALKRVLEFVEFKRLGFDKKEDYNEYKRLGFSKKEHYNELLKEIKALGFQTFFEYGECTSLGFVRKEDYDECKSLGFSNKDQYDEYKMLGFIEKAHYDEYVMLGFANKDAYMASRTCQICAEDISDPDERIGCAMGHNTCLSCAVGRINNALGDHASNIHPEGIRCVRHPHSLGGCPEFLNEAYFERVQNLSNRLGSDDALSQDQLQRLQQFISEANITAAVPSECLILCPSPECGQRIWIDKHNNGGTRRRRCPHCQVTICLDCLVLYHDGLTCEEYKAQQTARAQECQTEAYVQATTKPCPNCGARTSHFHGHECHHIRPGGGCTNCHIHWCYACGASEEENRRNRGGPSRCRCEGSYWSTFCNSVDIAANIVQLPYPHDRRCGCQICPECGPEDRCAACDGTCVVCRGLVPPGPTELPVVTPASHEQTPAAAIMPAIETEVEARAEEPQRRRRIRPLLGRRRP